MYIFTVRSKQIQPRRILSMYRRRLRYPVVDALHLPQLRAHLCESVYATSAAPVDPRRETERNHCDPLRVVLCENMADSIVRGILRCSSEMSAPKVYTSEPLETSSPSAIASTASLIDGHDLRAILSVVIRLESAKCIVMAALAPFPLHRTSRLEEVGSDGGRRQERSVWHHLSRSARSSGQDSPSLRGKLCN